MREQATEPRVPYGVWIEEGESGSHSFYLTRSLSPNGLLLEAKNPPPPGSPLRLRLVVENERRVMRFQGEVIRQIGDDEAADCCSVAFCNLAADQREFLDELWSEPLRRHRP